METNKTLDLLNNQYSEEELREYIYAVNLWDILKTQKISEEFAVEFILNNDFQLTEDEEKIKILDVLNLQPQLCVHKLLELCVVKPKKAGFPNFEEYSNRK
jgi:hypothetical protein